MSEFGNAGQKGGLEIWRIEKLVPTPVEQKFYGKFFTGDSYICLHTKARKSAFDWDIFFWLGNETSQDEAGVAAYKTVELDEYLGGSPVQHREVQGHESKEFLSLFRGGIEYLEGGVDSGFKHVARDQYETRLLHLKGRRNVRVAQTELSCNSLNSGDVFVLDAGLTLYQWNGASASKMEKAKGLEITTKIKDTERGGRAVVIVIDEKQAEDDDYKNFWELLGGKTTIKSAEEGGDDLAEEKKAAKMLKLFRVSDASGALSVEEVGSKPLKKDMLDTNDAFIVDTGAELFCWIGKGATKQEKSGAMKNSVDFLTKFNRPNWTPIHRVIELGETPQFKALFSDWKEFIPSVDFSLGYGLGSGSNVAKVEQKAIDIKALHKAKAQDEAMVDDGSGSVKIYRIEDFNSVEWPSERAGQFYAGDSYVIVYTYLKSGRENYIIYFWQGRDSSTDEKGASALIAKQMDDELGGQAVQVRVPQGKEPNHFLQLFKGRMIVRAGGRASGFTNLNDQDTYDTDGVSLYHVKGTNILNTRAIQVEEKAALLNSGDAFVLETPTHQYVWFGKGSNQDERANAKTVAEIMCGNRQVVEIEEGSESEEFWAPLGGKAPYADSPSLGTIERDPRLFQCSNASGTFDVEEIFNFCQDDLIDDDVMLLDTWEAIYIWVGRGANEEEKKKAMETAIEYVKVAEDGRSDDIPLYLINAGCEPPMFTSCFPGWDIGQAEDVSDQYEKALKELKDARESLKEYSKTYTLAELQKRPIASQLDPTKLESYLDDDEFLKAMQCTKAEFEGLPNWKKVNKKKAANLF